MTITWKNEREGADEHGQRYFIGERYWDELWGLYVYGGDKPSRYSIHATVNDAKKVAEIESEE